jgi:hypothetical protein
MEKTIMKPIGLISAGVLLLLIGAVAPAYAQDEPKQQTPQKQEEKAKPAKQQQEKPAQEQPKAKPEKQQQTKPEKQQEAKPAKQEKQQPAKPEKQQPAKSQQAQTKSQNQQQMKPVKATRQDQQQPARGEQGQKPEQAKGQWAHNGQKDSRGHVYSESKFGHDHHVRFEQNGGRFYNGRREYSFGGYWFYAGAYPPWFYQQDVYFVMGADGLWYAVSYSDPSLTFEVSIE